MRDAESIATETDDGWVLRGELHHPDTPEGPVAIVGHAMWVDRRTLDRPPGGGMVSTLVEAGIRVMSFDLRGHGESGPYAHEGADFSYDHYVRFDIPALVAAARQRFPHEHISVVGHSLTGHAAMISAGLCPDHAPDAVVGLAANLWLPRFDPHIRHRILKGLTLEIWDLAARPMGFFDVKRFRLGRWGVPRAYTEQLAEMYDRNRLGPMGGGAEYEAALEAVTLPVYSLSSEGDRWFATPKNVGAFLAMMPSAEVTRHVIHHRPDRRAPGHMELVLSNAYRPEWQTVAHWIIKQGARRDKEGA